MKKLVLFVSLFIFAGVSMAQLTEWTWDTYSTAFQAPEDFTVSKNEEKVFSAGNGDINLTIYPFKSSVPDDPSASIVAWANQNKITGYGDVEVAELNGYTGFFVEGVAPIRMEHL